MAILNTRAGGPVNAHIANLALQSGASLFTYVPVPPYPAFLAVLLLSNTLWVYDKTDNPALFVGYMHLVVESAALLAAGVWVPGEEEGWGGARVDGAGAHGGV
jgi:hypothetical protein